MSETETKMFKNIQELIEDSKNYSSVAELMIAIEMEQTGRQRDQIWALMERNLMTMLDSVEKGLEGKKSLTGLTGGDAKLMDDYIKSGKALSGDLILGAARDAVAVNEVNAQMGLICATPTAGSAGCLPGVLTSAIKKLQLSHEQQVEFCLSLVLLVLRLPIMRQYLVLKEDVRPKLGQLQLWLQLLWF